MLASRKSSAQDRKKQILSLLGDPKTNFYTPNYIVQSLSKDSLSRLEQFMRKNKTFTIITFLRFFSAMLVRKEQRDCPEQFFIHLALLKLFQEICNSRKKNEISFSDLSTHIAEMMPSSTEQNSINEKLLPFGLAIDEAHRSKIVPPEIYGQELQGRCFLSTRPLKSDKIQHLGRDVGQSEYSRKFKIYFTIDKPSDIISVLDQNFNVIKSLKTEQQMTKRDMIVTYIAWSDRQQKIACILGNYSISIWSRDDDYKYEVNCPLPGPYLGNPFTIIKYMESMGRWITLDNRPHIHVLSNENYEPVYSFSNSKLRKKKQYEKILLTEMKYVELLCVGFEKSVFLVSLKNKEIVSQVRNFKTSVNSLVFSESYQALFVSSYEDYFKSFELSQYQDLIQRGHFTGHKSLISLLGVIENKPTVFSLQENSILKMFDMRDYCCYQSFSVLKNIIYKQVLYLQEAICLIGSKMHVYPLQRELVYEEKEAIINISSLHRNLLVVTNKCMRTFDLRNGALKSVAKAVFGISATSHDIYHSHCMDNKQKLLISTEEGECVVLETNQMTEIGRWQLQPKPLFTDYDEQNDLLLHVSQGNINVSLFNNELCQKQLRRQIINNEDNVRLLRVSPVHDLIAVCYEQDETLYFYAYEKGKCLGYCNYGQKRVISFKNAYKKPKTIHRVVDIEFYKNQNCLLILLCDQLLVILYDRTGLSMSFALVKSIKLFQNPFLVRGELYNYDLDHHEVPLHATGLAIFQQQILVTSNKTNIVCSVHNQVPQLHQLKVLDLNKDSYNPSRVGTEQHLGIGDGKAHIETAEGFSHLPFSINYYVYGNKLGDFGLCRKIGNLLAIADQFLNIVLLQHPNWSQPAGLLNCYTTLPYLWQVFNYSEKEIKQVQFVLDFMENENLASPLKKLKNSESMGSQQGANKLQKLGSALITMKQLISENNLASFSNKARSSSLREKKIILEKERDEKEKQENFEEQQRLDKRQKPSNSYKDTAQKQINDTVGYLSLNHNETILKRGLLEEEHPAIRALELRLSMSVNKQDKKSLPSLKSNEQSLASSNKKGPEKKKSPAKLLTAQSEVYGLLTEKLSLQRYSSKELIHTLNSQKQSSKNSLKTERASISKFPSLFKL